MDWTEELKARLISTENARYTEVFIPYKLTTNGWRKLEWVEAHKIKIKDLCLGPYLLKIGDVGYLCGDDEVWEKQKEKPRAWTYSFFEKMFFESVLSGLTWKEILEFTFRHGVVVYWAHELLGGDFITKGEKCRSNQNLQSILTSTND